MENPANYLTVEALTKYIKHKFTADPYLQDVWVVGEISNFRLRPGGHQYFNLKDDRARISAVMFKNSFNKLPFQLEEGMKVLARGRITVYEPSGSYQMTIESLELDGIGALYQALEQLKARLAQEGLFNLPKKNLPRFPQKIAVITSPSGAVIRDIITTVKRRYPIVGLTVFPTAVQGKEAAGAIVSAFQQVSSLADQFDTVIVARGGGSIEDLWCFNDEAVARAIAACPLPVISSIGHETDTTIADLVADRRAPTPTAAAELAVPVLADLLQYLSQLTDRTYFASQQRLLYLTKRLERSSQSYVLQQPQRIYQPHSQRLDLVVERLKQQIQTYFRQQGHQLDQLRARLQPQDFKRLLEIKQLGFDQAHQQLIKEMQRLLEAKHHQLAQTSDLLDAYSPLKIMARGYNIVERAGQLIKSSQQLAPGDQVTIRWQDGSAQAAITDLNHESALKEDDHA